MIDQGLLVGPRSRRKTKGGGAFEVAAPKLWNSLPVGVEISGHRGHFYKAAREPFARAYFCLLACLLRYVYSFMSVAFCVLL